MKKRSILAPSAATCAVLFAATLPGAGAAQPGDDAEATEAADNSRFCLPHPMIDRTKILNGRNIVFVTHDHTIYNNQLPKGCPTLKRNTLVNYGIANGRLCAGDKFQVLWETSPRNYVPAFLCELGTFVPITEAELEDLMAMTDENRERRGRSSREAVTTEQVDLPHAETSTPAAAERAPPAE